MRTGWKIKQVIKYEEKSPVQHVFEAYHCDNLCSVTYISVTKSTEFPDVCG